MKKITALILAVVMCAGILCSCSNTDKDTAMSMDGGGKLSLNFMYLLTAFQNTMWNVTSYENFDIVIDAQTGATVNDFIKEQVKKSAENSLICEYLHDKVYGLTLTDAQKQGVDNQMAKYISQAGSKQQFEEQLSAYSANIASLKRYFEISLKQNNIYNLFYDTDGMYAIPEETVKKYFEDKYAVVTHIFFNTAFKSKEDGTLVSLTDEEIDVKTRVAQNVYSNILAGEDFYALRDYYTEDYTYPDGMFVTNDGEYPEMFTKAALEMRVGEYRMVETEGAGIHIMYKLPMKAELYNTNETVYNNIMSTLIAKDFDARLAEYKAGINVNEEKMALINPRIVPAFTLGLE